MTAACAACGAVIDASESNQLYAALVRDEKSTDFSPLKRWRCPRRPLTSLSPSVFPQIERTIRE
jgi:hypothetical protein